MQLQGGQQILHVQAPKYNSERNAPQDMYVWKGLRLIGAGGCNCLKGVFYYIEELCETSGSIALTDGTTLSLHQASRSLRLSYAITYTSCPGLTLKGALRLHTQGPFTFRHLYASSSGCTAADLLEIN